MVRWTTSLRRLCVVPQRGTCLQGQPLQQAAFGIRALDSGDVHAVGDDERLDVAGHAFRRRLSPQGVQATMMRPADTALPVAR